ncbi:hypothetical protein UT4_11660 [Ferrigenium sp. UT4]
MSDISKIENLKNKLIELRGQDVLLDSDVAQLYGVETKRINEAVKNNPEKFPAEYIIRIEQERVGQIEVEVFDFNAGMKL